MRLFVLTLLFVSTAAFSVDTPKVKQIRYLMQLMQADVMGGQVLERTVALYKAQYPKVPEAFWAELKKEYKGDKFADLAVPIYDKYFTPEEIGALVKFYESPAGKKYVMVQPKLVGDLMMSGQKWGQELTQAVSRKLAAKGYAGDETPQQKPKNPAGQ